MSHQAIPKGIKTELLRIQELNWGIRGVNVVLADEDVQLPVQVRADLHSALAALTVEADHALEKLIDPLSGGAS